MNKLTFEDRPPFTDWVNAYDKQHFVTYLRLLDASADGADWRTAVQIIFGLDADQEPERAKIVHDRHLARARWMTENGYRYLLDPGRR